MRVPKEVVLLGLTQSCIFSRKGEYFETKFRNNENLICCSASGKVVYFLPNKSDEIEMPRGKQKLKGMFKRWSGLDVANQAYAIDLKDEKTLNVYKTGLVHQVIYMSDKWSGDWVTYQHDYSKRSPPSIYVERHASPNVWAISHKTGKKIVNRRGLIG